MTTARNSKQMIYKLRAIYEGKGEFKQLNQDLKALNKVESIKKLGGEIRTLSARFSEAKKNLEKQAAEMKKADAVTKEMEKSYKQAQSTVKKLAASLEKKKTALRQASTAAQEMGVNTKQLVAEEKRLAKTVASSGKVLAARTTLGLKSNKDLRVQVQNLENAYRLLKSSGAATVNELFTAKQKLKQKTAVTAGVGAMNAYGKSVDDLEDVYDALFTTVKKGVTTFPELAQNIGDVLPVARSAGVVLPEVGAAIAALTKAGIATPKAATSLKGAIRAMAAPAPDAKKKFDLLGISWQGLLPTLEQIADKGLSIDQMRMLIPDAEASTGVLSLTQNLDEFKDILLSMDDAGGAMQKAYSKIADTPQHDIDLMKKSLADLSKDLGSLASAVLVPAAKTISTVVSSLNDSGAAVKTITSIIGGSVSAMVLWKLGVGDIVTAVYSMGTKFHSLADAVGVYSGSVVLAKKATASLVTLVKGNPVLATVSGVALTTAAAWALLGNNSLEASHKHAEAAEKIGEGRKEIDKEIQSLTRLQQIFNSSNPSAERFTEAERKLAELLPGANISLDKHGKVIAKVGDSASQNAVKLDAYIQKLKEESQLNLALQVEQQVQAYVKAETALQKYKDNLANWYGIGGQDDWAASIWRSVNKLTGTYDKNIQKGEEVRANLYKQKAAYEQLLTSMAKAGVSSDDLATSLDRMHISAELKSSILDSYAKLTTNLESAKDTAKSSMDAMAKAAEESARKQNEAFKKTTANIKGEYLRLASEVKGILREISMEEENLASELREMNRSTMTPLQAWRDLKAEADEYYKKAEEAASAGDYDTAKRLLDEAKIKYKELNTEVKKGKQTIISEKEALEVAAEGYEKSSRKKIEVLKQAKDEALADMDELAGKAGPFAETWSTAFDTFLNDGKAAISSLEQELDHLVKERSITLGISTVEQKQSGGVIGLRLGGLVEPQRLKGGGSVKMLNGLAGLALAGYGGGDRRHILGEDGEVMLRKEAVRAGGLKAALAFNAGNFELVIEELMKRFNIGPLIRRSMGGVINSTPALAPVSSSTIHQASTHNNNDYKFNIDFKGTPQSLSDPFYVRSLTRTILAEFEKMQSEGAR